MTASWVALLVLALGACGDRSPRPAAAGAVEPSSGSTLAQSLPIQSTLAASDGIELYPAAQLARVAGELATRATTGQTIGGHPTYHYVQARRVASGEPELHDAWIDVTIVQAGHATLLAGGRIDAGRLVSAGEHRGGSIVGGTPHSIAAGDLVVVPAGIPHQFRIAYGDSVRYLTLKVLEPPSGEHSSVRAHR